MYKYTRKQVMKKLREMSTDIHQYTDDDVKRLFLEKKQWKPELESSYYYPSLINPELYTTEKWIECGFDKCGLERGLVCKTKQQAINLSKKMLQSIKDK